MAWSTGTKDVEDANSSRRTYNLIKEDVNEIWDEKNFGHLSVRRGKKWQQEMKTVARWDVARFDGSSVWGE